jgi:2-hydroxychromene-2-carboxylate isomerase
MVTIDFWFSIGSTYSYLSVLRLSEVAAREGVAFRWRPFNVREIMIEMNNFPFVNKPAKAAYMWRDLERRAALHGLAYQDRPPYMIKDLARANRVAVVGAREGWCEAYARATYQRWFLAGEEAGSEPNLSASLRAAGVDPARVLGEADSEAGVAALAAETAAARAAGIFGTPSFVVDGELFWGDDRLDDAIRWARGAWPRLQTPAP